MGFLSIFTCGIADILCLNLVVIGSIPCVSSSSSLIILTFFSLIVRDVSSLIIFTHSISSLYLADHERFYVIPVDLFLFQRSQPVCQRVSDAGLLDGIGDPLQLALDGL